MGFEENDRLREATERSQAERDARSNVDKDVIDVYPPGLLSDLKTMKAEIDLQFAKLMAHPYQAPEIVDDFKSTINQNPNTKLGSPRPIGIPGAPWGP